MKSEILKALNQLTSLVVGKQLAIQTNHLIDDPAARINELIGSAAQEVSNGAISGDQKAMKQGQRKLESLGSLKLLADELAE